MQIAIVGTGAIGSTFAFHLSKAGHAVTVIARGSRLEQLQRDQAIVLVTGERAAVGVSPELDATTPWDLVLVTVLASQVDAVLPALKASAARTVMFMFNTFEALDRLRDAVGEGRFAFGFPAMLSTLTEGKLKREVLTRGQITTVTDPAWARVFTEAGILTVVHDDMQSWLRTHAVFVIPLLSIASVSSTRGAGLTWSEARAHALAMSSGFRIVRSLGNAITPSAMLRLSQAPTSLVAALLWAMSRNKSLRELGTHGVGEARTLVDQIAAAAPGQAAELLAIRP